MLNDQVTHKNLSVVTIFVVICIFIVLLNVWRPSQKSQLKLNDATAPSPLRPSSIAELERNQTIQALDTSAARTSVFDSPPAPTAAEQKLKQEALKALSQ